MGVKDKLKDIPKAPGVYLMKDGKGEVLYIGKAKDLSKRVPSYFQKSRPRTAKETALLEHVKDLDFIVTSSEEEALIYEAGLVKEKRPRYNVDLKDDKSFPYLKLTLNEKFPRLLITRKRKDNGARYFGPYARVKLLRKALSIMKAIFPLRTCAKMSFQVCLSYRIGQCAGPCAGKIDQKKYREIVRQLILFLEGRKTQLLDELTKKMNSLALARNFEEAAIIRNRIAALSEVPGRRFSDYSGWGEVAVKLKRLLRLPWLPLRIEAFDVSNIAGREATGSMVYFLNGRPDKSNYRKFKIKGVKDIDDYAMIREIVKRRYARLKEEKAKFPDLVIIDGGKGHLRAAYEELLGLNLRRIPVISIAKEHEKIYTLGSKTPLDINRDSEIVHFIQQIRDEAHRFALKYHHKLREKKILVPH
ncbi:MAG: excinuclease ABC subunit UvrC [Candidatus Omnitrophica bacterium]|nr:excinuclease ABC subunit UvrC [Candidatus Omnitrophota bacterium]MBU1933297.1 excinuclease ABC subunit UvrC [Candidatus Omnitrophota bacterium]